ncbi:hypothetical protein BG015_009403 [Linnemannia schmuckeri]|uniref:Uncharacterized protein n=1 Tax=Linnemannia schmuckeri TaxID=64567 RepID=A0A9P5RVZ7_9FUNG|nr:hypothetical protein BG015_009403 [Linnemannia schmuckeri]
MLSSFGPIFPIIHPPSNFRYSISIQRMPHIDPRPYPKHPPQPNLQTKVVRGNMMAITHQKSARADDAPRQNGNNQSIFLNNEVVNVGGQAPNPPQPAGQPGVPNQNQNPGPQGGPVSQPPATA